jgi:hypothetical protein
MKVQACVMRIRVVVPPTLPVGVVSSTRLDIVYREIIALEPANVQSSRLDPGRIPTGITQDAKELGLVAVRLELGRGDHRLVREETLEESEGLSVGRPR